MLFNVSYITLSPATKQNQLCAVSCLALCAVGLWSSFDRENGIQNDMKNHIRNHKGKHIDKNNKNHIYSSQLS